MAVNLQTVASQPPSPAPAVTHGAQVTRLDPAVPVPLVLVVALFAVSAAGTLVRLAPDAHPLTLALGRVLVAGLVLLPLAGRGFRRPSARDLGLTALAGTFLALHFWTWFASLQQTSVMRSTVIVCSTPIWVGLLEAVVFRRPPRAHYWPGIAVALVGIVGLALSAPAARGGPVFGGPVAGDALALAGSWLGAGYFVIGSAVRTRVGIGVYGPAICFSAAAVLLVLSLAVGAPLIPMGPAVGVVLALAAGPQLLGHIGFNWAVRYVPASLIAAVILVEPVGASALAAVCLGEWPTWRDGLWAVVLLTGVGVAVRG